jgi:hypothetical protein
MNTTSAAAKVIETWNRLVIHLETLKWTLIATIIFLSIVLLFLSYDLLLSCRRERAARNIIVRRVRTPRRVRFSDLNCDEYELQGLRPSQGGDQGAAETLV